MKYIFVAGAPGSKWSAIVKNIYYSHGVDRSDYRDEWTFRKGPIEFHYGAYFDPGMTHHLPEHFSTLTRLEIENIFDSPFITANNGVRIIKSHIFSNNIDFLRAAFPECPILTVYRSNEECYNWWVNIGNFEISYPNYLPFYKNLNEMRKRIEIQNRGILDAWSKHPSKSVDNIEQLLDMLQLQPDPVHYYPTDFEKVNATVKVLF